MSHSTPSDTTAPSRPSTVEPLPAWLESAKREDPALRALAQSCHAAGYALAIGRVGTNADPAFAIQAMPASFSQEKQEKQEKRTRRDEMPLSAVFKNPRGLQEAIRHLDVQFVQLSQAKAKPAERSTVDATSVARSAGGAQAGQASDVAHDAQALAVIKRAPSSAGALSLERIESQPCIETLRRLCGRVDYELVVRELARRDGSASRNPEFGLAAIPKRGGAAEGRAPEQPAPFSTVEGLHLAVRSVGAGMVQARQEMAEEREKKEARAAANAAAARERRESERALAPSPAPVVGVARPLARLVAAPRRGARG